jgi:ribonuclease BN (tRNA processing enzyme)
VRGGPIAKETVRKYLGRQMEPPYFPVSFAAMKAEFDFTHGIPMVREIASATLTPIPLSHPNGGYGFRLEEAGKSLVFLTDNELGFQHEGSRTFPEYVDFCEGADLLVHDAQYTVKEYETHGEWGHSTYNAAVDLAIRAGVRRLALSHHDPDHTDGDVDRIQEVARELARRRNSPLECFAAAEGLSIAL